MQTEQKAILILLISLLCLSLSFNLFQFTTTEVTCGKIDSRWKADLLYKIGHHKLDGDKDGIPCESLHDFRHIHFVSVKEIGYFSFHDFMIKL